MYLFPFEYYIFIVLFLVHWGKLGKTKCGLEIVERIEYFIQDLISDVSFLLFVHILKKDVDNLDLICYNANMKGESIYEKS